MLKYDSEFYSAALAALERAHGKCASRGSEETDHFSEYKIYACHAHACLE